VTINTEIVMQQDTVERQKIFFYADAFTCVLWHRITFQLSRVRAPAWVRRCRI